MEELPAGIGELPKQVPFDSRLGRPVHQSERTYQQRDCHEDVPVLQGEFQIYFFYCLSIQRFLLTLIWK